VNIIVHGCGGRRGKCEELKKIVFDDDKEKFFQVGVQLSP